MVLYSILLHTYLIIFFTLPNLSQPQEHMLCILLLDLVSPVWQLQTWHSSLHTTLFNILTQSPPVVLQFAFCALDVEPTVYQSLSGCVVDEHQDMPNFYEPNV